MAAAPAGSANTLGFGRRRMESSAVERRKDPCRVMRYSPEDISKASSCTAPTGEREFKALSHFFVLQFDQFTKGLKMLSTALW